MWPVPRTRILEKVAQSLFSASHSIKCSASPICLTKSKGLESHRDLELSLSLEEIRFHTLLEKDNAQLHYRCHLQLPVKGTYLMLKLCKNKIFCCFIQEQNHWRFSGRTKYNSWNEWLAFISNVIKILFLLHSRPEYFRIRINTSRIIWVYCYKSVKCWLQCYFFQKWYEFCCKSDLKSYNVGDYLFEYFAAVLLETSPEWEFAMKLFLFVFDIFLMGSWLLTEHSG